MSATAITPKDRRRSSRRVTICIALNCLILHPPAADSQGLGGSATIRRTILDPTGGALDDATVEVRNRVSGYRRTTFVGQTGSFQLTNVPSNSYRVTATASG